MVILFVDYCGWFGGGEFGSGAELTASRPRVLVKFVMCVRRPIQGGLKAHRSEAHLGRHFGAEFR